MDLTPVECVAVPAGSLCSHRPHSCRSEAAVRSGVGAGLEPRSGRRPQGRTALDVTDVDFQAPLLDRQAGAPSAHQALALQGLVLSLRRPPGWAPAGQYQRKYNAVSQDLSSAPLARQMLPSPHRFPNQTRPLCPRRSPCHNHLIFSGRTRAGPESRGVLSKA
jgi:hypothetical protein